MPQTAADRGPVPAEATYDVVIIGAGIAGLSAAIYTTRERLTTLVLEKMMPGGQILTTSRVENYPGFPDPIGGMELADRLASQAVRFGAEIVSQAQVTRIEPHMGEGEGKCILAFAGAKRYCGRSMILAVGSEYRRLDVPGEKRLTGYGVSYCGTCDAPLYRDKRVVVVGGGNTALDEGLHLLKYASNLTFVTLGDTFRASQILIDDLGRHADKVETCFLSTVTEIVGDKKAEGVRIRNTKTNEEKLVPCDGVFIFVGLSPLTAFLKGVVDLDDRGFILTNACTLQTSVPGIWAAGDVRAGTLKQAATAAGDGVIAALMAKEFLKQRPAEPSAP